MGTDSRRVKAGKHIAMTDPFFDSVRRLWLPVNLLHLLSGVAGGVEARPELVILFRISLSALLPSSIISIIAVHPNESELAHIGPYHRRKPHENRKPSTKTLFSPFLTT